MLSGALFSVRTTCQPPFSVVDHLSMFYQTVLFLEQPQLKPAFFLSTPLENRCLDFESQRGGLEVGSFFVPARHGVYE